ncbi:alpha/beta hydrolase [Streptomyces sp. TRM 70361]|uniref:alpha/beta hydrolase n=1 Tax=Streptomyces sp. TRM 70361 TaxID=3116553 RepID=UPI002E7BFBB0|nr:alpha/beta hydrolase [Streptomyces sp. TRM 70361]MEE1941367.1 alpha/beta hydrolase [Streptomyces sp. TRM 70361]
MQLRARGRRVRGARHLWRIRRALLTALVAASVAVPVSGAAGAADVPAPPPAALGPVDADSAALAVRYRANRENILAAARTADGHGDRRRAAALRAMAAPDRHFLTFDGRNGGRSAEVLGNLARAERIAVLVPGADTDFEPERYESLRAGAEALWWELDGRSAVVAWLGYRTPNTLGPSVLTTGRAEGAAPALRGFVAELAAARPGTRVSVLCHSYGAVLCGRAAAGLAADDLVLYGSPGAGVDSAAALRTRAAVWAGRSSRDWIALVPHTRAEPAGVSIGLGADPVAPGFGARVFPAGDGGHGDYLRPGSLALRNIVRIVSGLRPAGEDGRA